jgi:hypothetical protein
MLDNCMKLKVRLLTVTLFSRHAHGDQHNRAQVHDSFSRFADGLYSQRELTWLVDTRRAYL